MHGQQNIQLKKKAYDVRSFIPDTGGLENQPIKLILVPFFVQLSNTFCFLLSILYVHVYILLYYMTEVAYTKLFQY